MSPHLFKKIGYRAFARAYTACQTNNNHLLLSLSFCMKKWIPSCLSYLSGVPFPWIKATAWAAIPYPVPMNPKP